MPFSLSKAVTICICCISQAYAFDKLSIDEGSGLFIASDQTVPIVTSQYIGWEANWLWAGADMKREVSNAKKQSLIAYTGNSSTLDLAFTSQVELSEGRSTWNYTWDKKADHLNAAGFGIEFSLNMQSPTFTSPPKEPELLPDNKGWRWQLADGRTMEVTFTPALAKLYFEQNQKNQIRAFFFGSVNKGSEKTAMQVSFDKKVTVGGVASAKYGDFDLKSWQRNILPEKVSPIDLSFLNKNDMPAGKHGFIKAKGDKLVFKDGTPVKFWGGNLMAYALLSTSDVDIKAQAKRIAQLGFNLMRFHHFDSSWVQPNIFKNQTDNTQELSTEAFKKLDWWIKCLKDQGVYVWLDLHVGREFTKKDGIDHFDDMAKGNATTSVKGFNYYNESIQQQMQKFNETFLSHVNPHTKLAYKADPAVFTVLITNENDLTHHFGNQMLPDKGNPEHHAIFSNDVKQFEQAAGLPLDKAWRTWEMGESKIYLSDAEHRFNQKMIKHLNGLGVKSMIATTNSWGGMGIYGLPALTDGDLIDAHSYGRAEEINANPRFNPSFLAWIGGSQVTGKPLSVTEWNMEPFPAVDRFISPVLTASVASLQGWDAMMIYGYSQNQLGGWSQGSNYSTYNDPAITGMMPLAALIYRQGHVSQAKQNYELRLSEQDFFYKKQDPTTSKTIRTLLETSRLTIAMPELKALPWLKNSQDTEKTVVINDANQDFIPEGQNFVQSDTGELKRDWDKGLHTVNTSRSQIASGWIGGNEINLADVTFSIATKKAVAAVQSLDDKPIKQSRKLFLTLMARSIPVTEGEGFLSEPVSGALTISAPQGLKLYPIDILGNKKPAIAVDYTKGKYRIKLDDKNPAHWFMLTAN